MSRPLMLPQVLLLGILPGAAVSQEPVNESNWQTHPAIVEIRAIYNSIEAAVAEGKLQEQSKTVECYGGSVELELTIFADSSGVIRKYVKTGGSGDAAGEVRYYYDTAGELRFALELYRHYNGTSRETRVYFDVQGERIYTDRRLLAGPGYIGGFQLNVFDPAAAFSDPC